MEQGVTKLNLGTACYSSKFLSVLIFEARGGVVVKTQRYKPEGRGFDSRWWYQISSLTILPVVKNIMKRPV
jgi:hypothetical protein